MKLLLLLYISSILAIVRANECHRNYVHEKAGEVTSPGYPQAYPENAFCNYNIEVRDGEHVNFKVDAMQTTMDKGHDLLMLFDGADCMAERLGVYSEASAWPMISSTNKLTAVFFSDMSKNDIGFKANFKAEKRLTKEEFKHGALYFSRDVPDALLNCGSELPAHNNSFEVPVSTRMPNVCIWRITGAPNQRINVTISNAQNLGSSNWLRVLDGGSCDKKTLTYVHSVHSSKEYNATSTGNQVIIFMVRVPGFTSQNKIQISYTLSEAAHPGMKNLRELSNYFPADYKIPKSSSTKPTQLIALVMTWALVSIGVVFL